MKIKSLITLALLFVLGFSIVHEYVFVLYDNEHSSVSEYVAELDAPSHHGDICDTHFEYHQAFILPQHTHFPRQKYHFSKMPTDKESYNFHTSLNFFKPPIA